MIKVISLTNFFPFICFLNNITRYFLGNFPPLYMPEYEKELARLSFFVPALRKWILKKSSFSILIRDIEVRCCFCEVSCLQG